MFHYFKIQHIAAVLCVAALLPLISLSAQAQNRMNAKAVGVISEATVGNGVGNGAGNGVGNGNTNNEVIRFEGAAVVNSRMAADADFGKPSLIMLFDLTGVTGTGAKSGTKYVLTNQEYIIRPLAMHHNIEFTFPMTTEEDAPIEKARVGSARFVMNVDLGTGAITSLNAVMKAH